MSEKIGKSTTCLEECEETFFNRALVAFDEKHFQEEDRYYLLGETNRRSAHVSGRNADNDFRT